MKRNDQVKLANPATEAEAAYRYTIDCDVQAAIDRAARINAHLPTNRQTSVWIELRREDKTIVSLKLSDVVLA